MSLRGQLQKYLPPAAHQRLKRNWHRLSQALARKSLQQALDEQNLSSLAQRLAEIVPDIKDQYTALSVDSPYLALKVRALHAFQVSMIQKGLELLQHTSPAPITIVDIGDSRGTHLQYINGIFRERNIRSLSVNLDPEAVRKIRANGLEALHCRAEDLFDKHSLDVQIFLSFETLEHLFDPVDFLRKLASRTNAEMFILTVPYLRTSRVGLRHIRNLDARAVTAEEMHVFELSPGDWDLIFKLAGWTPIFSGRFLQYPRWNWARLLKWYWTGWDFEGFHGVILKKDDRWTRLYKDW